MTYYRPRIDAIDFLRKIQRFTPYLYYTADFDKDFNEDETYRELEEFGKEDSDFAKDRSIKKEQIRILAKIFIPELPDNISYNRLFKIVQSGDFLEKRDLKRYEDLFKEMEYFMSINSYTMDYWKANLSKEELQLDIDGLQFSYSNCFRFKIKLLDLIDFNAGVKESSYKYAHALLMTNYTSRSISTRYLDDFLGKVIDPEGQKFTLEELKEKYNYPEDFRYPRYD